MRLLTALLVAGILLVLGPSAALGSHALTPERYAALDAAYTALIPLDRDRVPASALSAARRACNGLDPADALLRPMRGQCLAVVRVFELGQRARCRTREGCRRLIARLRTATTSYLRHTRSANRAIDASVPARDCRLALRTGAKEVDLIKQVARVLRAVERALKTGSDADVLRALPRLERLLRNPGPSARQERDRFRSACA